MIFDAIWAHYGVTIIVAQSGGNVKDFLRLLLSPLFGVDKAISTDKRAAILVPSVRSLEWWCLPLQLCMPLLIILSVICLSRLID